MARTTGVILAVGGISLFNEVVLLDQPFNWKIPIATGIAAVLFTGFEHLAPDVAVGVAWIALVAVTFTRVNPAVPAPAESLAGLVGTKKG